uniref:Cupin domain-containing protein n=1 Tax=viral metagenome TaxID=1070528 RepID=A0A6M3XQ03_9ZZZZ
MNENLEIKIEEINVDKRGSIYRILFRNREFIILFTKKGYLRGGDYHKSIQTDIILSGKIMIESPNKQKILIEGQSITFSPYEPHYFEAIEDSLVLEWLSGPFEKKYYKPYRNKVRELM